jgi:hypothetical protein
MHLSSARQSRRLITRLLAVLFVAVGLPTLIASSASAHHPEIIGSADCAGRASFTAKAWAGSTSAERTNTSVRVDRSFDNGQTWQFVVRDQFTSANGFDFTGSFSMGGATVVKLRVTAENSWGNGAGGGQQQYADVYAPTNCGNAVITNDCANAAITLNNTGATARTFTITSSPAVNGTSTWTRSVTGNSTSGVSVPGLLEDTSYTFTVKMGNTVVKTQTVRPDCAKPAASLTKDCTAWTIVLDNTANNVSATYTVTVDGTATTHTIAKTTKTITVPVAEDSTHTVTVTVDGTTLVQESSTVECQTQTQTQTPTPTPTPTTETEVLGQTSGRATGRLQTSCQRTVRVTMKNGSASSVVYKIRVGDSISKKTVAAGKKRVWTTTARNRSVVKLTLGSQLLAKQRVPKACPRPEVLPETGKRASA